MPSIRKFVVTPNLPEPLKPLLDIARNAWWSWNVEAISLLRRVDPDQWDHHAGNPVAVLGSLSAQRVRELERDQAFLAHLERADGADGRRVHGGRSRRRALLRRPRGRGQA